MILFKKILAAILILESRLILAKYRPFIVAVTGSVGKTSTKDAIYSVLKNQSNYVRKSEKSLNSEIGLPLTIIGVPNAWHSLWGWLRNISCGLGLIFRKNEYPDCLVLEIGADHPGDIRKIARWLHPEIAVVTQVSSTPVHVEFFKSPKEVFEEKASLATAVKKGGTLVLFADNEKVLLLGELVKDKDVKVISFGTINKADVKGSEQRIVYELAEVPVSATAQISISKSISMPISTSEESNQTSSIPVSASNSTSLAVATKIPSGFTFKLNLNGMSTQVSINGLLGRSYMYPLLAAAAVGKVKDVPISAIINGLNNYEAPKSRMNIIAGSYDTTLIDDSYNSSPDAVISALNTLKELETNGSKIIALGDMMELGHYSAEEHRRIGREVVGVASVLVTVGQRSRTTADEAVKNGFVVGNVHAFDNSIEAGEFLKTIIKTGDLVLIKGSQSIRMERIVKMLMKYPDQADQLVVRQEKEWLEKA
ncbi:MAG: hypothetical protein A3C79_01115 [Candidatus Taylorbacteria bacterium RIFCSPHIGHO2_02_FULL_45_28]|uniref:UDP-N-acetylmuramoyl-tripeptide--D-alanyl-D-alanine ligase n=1 Tax=Candidatus Taylorbacteria bacterium RIFCSPHIGHO2_12_FULL_45_16 TaxID=1802315 RepID=A0A1G2MZB1_9BACT|nr:MAG: hypothetical protein A2830_02365 [Candidatus Taylorbacteria bacterium RIFCSPHIGHO2_01_FULL_44_110]OHA25619.1 MAG: hypothetical protein A3C79_01115 [Candidatus Taylorbacteria bacterium RIFCSPHIGHO2_02_FULL_45_28]OHA29285.1 MAG: hypothetical protein A3F51_01580 [Candidatus Taylorbacteria bacterium RIFCSPHIGHO2_12_FULL_45_16]OHA33507.1 MAG: hypothetical protein A3A23_02460 [Candidatus Taylorbacteria bacterium RIFCSPLOWO2_01_FULL_45_59]OHA39130.1 MAG: hypothetical protein A3I98_00805 [Candi